MKLIEIVPPPPPQDSRERCDVALPHSGICQSSQSSQSHSLPLRCCRCEVLLTFCWLSFRVCAFYYLYCSSWESDVGLICGASKPQQTPHYMNKYTDESHMWHRGLMGRKIMKLMTNISDKYDSLDYELCFTDTNLAYLKNHTPLLLYPQSFSPKQSCKML